MIERAGKAGDATRGRIERQIEENLKRVYDETLKEDIPDRLKELLARLRAEDGKK